MNDDVWYLTIVHKGHVTLTTIMAYNGGSAGDQTYQEFLRLFGKVVAWNMTNCAKDVSMDMIAWHNKEDDIKATLIKA